MGTPGCKRTTPKDLCLPHLCNGRSLKASQTQGSEGQEGKSRKAKLKRRKAKWEDAKN